MKISKNKFLYLLAKNMVGMVTQEKLPESHYTMVATSFAPMFNSIKPSFLKKGILDETDRVDIDKLKFEAEKFFDVVPTLQVPIQGHKFAITLEEVRKFIKDLYNYADVDEVIYLPCQS